MKARDYLFYIPYIVLGLIIAVPLSWLEQKLGKAHSANGCGCSGLFFGWA